MKKFAFTLAEVLITIGIIGIIAAMTLPTLIHSINGRELQTQFEKTYADLNNAAKVFYNSEGLSVSAYSTAISANRASSNQIIKRFMSYFAGKTETLKYTLQQFDEKHKITQINLNGKPMNKYGQYPCDTSYVVIDNIGRLYAMDDSPHSYLIRNNINKSYGPKICVDINGIKSPNQLGVDRFVFVFTDDNRIEPYTGFSGLNLTEQMTDEKEIAKYCSYSQTSMAHTCAYFAAKNKGPNGKGNYWTDFL